MSELLEGYVLAATKLKFSSANQGLLVRGE
jgi:hypothetical protein